MNANQSALAQTLLGALKSKTINVNVILTAILVYYFQAKGLPIDGATTATIVALAYGIANVILRTVTKKSLPEKGIIVKNPAAVQAAANDIADAIIENKDKIAELYAALIEYQKIKKTRHA